MKTAPRQAAPVSRTAIGRQGEELACAELARRGYEIVARNWRCPGGEVDIIARHDGCLVFVEVKTRRPRGGVPEEGLTLRKTARIIAAAQSYVGQTGAPEDGWRIDLVAIELGRDGQPLRISIAPAMGIDA